MPFESLSNKLNKALKNITGKGKLTEKNMNDMLKEVRMSLLEADVNYRVVKEFIDKIKIQAQGTEVMSSLNPGQMVVKIVHDEIVALLGEEEVGINYRSSGVTTIMMVGLQGTGKTTAAAKIANVIRKKQSRKPLLVACDIIRPAAIEQLKTLGASIGVEVFSLGVETKALDTAQAALTYAIDHHYDTVIFDTAGRLHIDEELMQELADIKQFVQPDEILLTVDAMTGQDIVNVAQSFHDQLEVTGLVLTKLDGDARGGGILSVRSITRVPVKFVGLGEKIDDLDIFYPSRMADRILGMGDIMSLVEQAQDKMDLEVGERGAKRMMSGVFTLQDMLEQFQQIKKMGSFSSLMKLIPGMGQMASQINEAKSDDQMKKFEAIILSMTKQERDDPSILKASRKNRIAAGSGAKVSEVNQLISRYEKTKVAMKQMAQMTKGGKTPSMSDLQSMKGNSKMKPRMGKRRF